MLKTDPHGKPIDPLGDQRVAEGYRRWQPGDRVYWIATTGGWHDGMVAEASDVVRVIDAGSGRLWVLKESELMRSYPREGGN